MRLFLPVFLSVFLAAFAMGQTTQPISAGARILSLDDAKEALRKSDTPKLAKQLPVGVMVLEVKPDGGFAKAGVQDGDILTRAGSQPIKDVDSFIKWLSTCSPGKSYPILVMRADANGKWQYRSLTMSAVAPASTAPTPPPVANAPSEKANSAFEDRVRQLEAENRELRERLASLESELRNLRAAANKDASKPKPAAEKPSVPAGPREKSFAKIGEVEVTMLDYGVGRVPLTYLRDKTQSKDELLWVKVRINNLSVTKKADYATWRGTDFALTRDFASAKDNFGNILKRIDFGFATEVEGGVKHESIYPGKAVEDILVFERPVDGTTTITLELPPKNVGGEGDAIVVELPMK